MRRAALAALVLLTCAAVPEPDGFRMDHYRDPVPDTLHGAQVLRTADLQKLLSRHGAILIDVLPAPHPPPDRPPGSLWIPLPRRDIPGSIWLPDVGSGVIDPALQTWFASRLHAQIEAHPGETAVFYCLSHCWMSWNAARRAVQLGIGPVAWYPDGSDGWEAAGLPLAAVTPEK